MSRSGADLALLLLGGFRRLVDAATVELADRGYPDYQAHYDFAMRAIESGASSASDLARRLSVSKQAAAKTIGVLMERGYVSRDADPDDARRKRLLITPLGLEVMHAGEEIIDDLRAQWEERVGASELAGLEALLTTLVGDGAVRAAAPGWVSHAGHAT